MDFCNKKEMILKHGLPYKPTTTGAVERFNQTLVKKIRRLDEFGEISQKK